MKLTRTRAESYAEAKLSPYQISCAEQKHLEVVCREKKKFTERVAALTPTETQFLFLADTSSYFVIHDVIEWIERELGFVVQQGATPPYNVIRVTMLPEP